MGKANLHLHTNLTDGFNTPEEMVLAAVEKKLDLIAITDHGLIKPAYLARDFALKEKLPLEVILGQEVTAKEGQIIGLFIKDQIPSLTSIFKAAELIKKQNGLVVICHPMRIFLGHSVWSKTIDQLCQENLVDALEIYNFWDHSPFLPKMRKAKAKQWRLAQAASTDSHFSSTIGEIYTEFPGKTSQDLYQAIKEKKTKPVNHSSFFFKRKMELKHIWAWTVRELKGPRPKFPGQIKMGQKLLHVLKFS